MRTLNSTTSFTNSKKKISELPLMEQRKRVRKLAMAIAEEFGNWAIASDLLIVFQEILYTESIRKKLEIEQSGETLQKLALRIERIPEEFLSIRVKWALETAGYSTVWDICAWTESAIRNIRGIGITAVKQISKYIKDELGLTYSLNMNSLPKWWKWTRNNPPIPPSTPSVVENKRGCILWHLNGGN